jgi:hypothetical protein
MSLSHAEETPGKWIILPNSVPRTTWDLFMILLVLYNAFALPFVVGFDVEPGLPLVAWHLSGRG